MLQELCPVPAQQPILSLKSVHPTQILGSPDMCITFFPSGWMPLNIFMLFPHSACLGLFLSLILMHFSRNLSLSLISKPPPMYRVSSHVRLTPPSCLLDLFIMPARGNYVPTLLGFMFFFSDTTVTWEACWLLLILVSFWFHFSCVLPSASVYFDLFSAAVFPLPPFIDFKWVSCRDNYRHERKTRNLEISCFSSYAQNDKDNACWCSVIVKMSVVEALQHWKFLR